MLNAPHQHHCSLGQRSTGTFGTDVPSHSKPQPATLQKRQTFGLEVLWPPSCPVSEARVAFISTVPTQADKLICCWPKCPCTLLQHTMQPLCIA